MTRYAELSDLKEETMATHIASTRVWHDGKPFDVSTIDRECSAIGASDMIYAETIVWEVLPDGSRGKIVHQGEAARGSIANHIEIVSSIRDFGVAELLAQEGVSSQPQYREPTLEDARELFRSALCDHEWANSDDLFKTLKQLGFVRKVTPNE